jgi:hypothetical protein
MSAAVAVVPQHLHDRPLPRYLQVADALRECILKDNIAAVMGLQRDAGTG